MRQYERQSSEVVHAAYASHAESANLNAAVLLVEVGAPGWPIRYANAAWQDIAGGLAAQPVHDACFTAPAQSECGVSSQQTMLLVEEQVPAVMVSAQMALQHQVSNAAVCVQSLLGLLVADGLIGSRD